MKLKLTLAIVFDKQSRSVILSIYNLISRNLINVTYTKNVLVCKLHAVLLPKYHIQTAASQSLRKKGPYSEFFWSVFFHIRTEYGQLRSKSPYSVRMWENAGQKNSEYGHILRIEFVWNLTVQVGRCTPEGISRKSYVTTFMASIDQNFLRIILNISFQLKQ